MARFRTPREAQDAFETFFRAVAAHPELGRSLAAAGVSLRIRFRRPDFSLTLYPARNGPPYILVGSDAFGVEEGTSVGAEVEMDAATAHQIFAGRKSLEMSVLLGRVRWVGGTVPRASSLVKALKRCFKIYPQTLRQQGMGHLL